MTTQKPLPFSDKPTLELRADAIDFVLVPIARGEAPFLEVDGHAGAEAVEIRTEGEVTRVSLAAPWLSLFDLPVRKLVLHVPEHVRARVESAAGRLQVERLAGCDLDLTTHAGSVTLSEVRGRIKVSVDSGAVRGERLGGTFDVRSAAGSVRLAIDALDEGTHRVRTSMGSVKVELAKGLSVRLETATTLGSVRTKYPSTPDAKAVLQLSAELGSVRVVEGDAVDDPRHGDWPDWQRTWRDVADAVASTFGAVREAVEHELTPPPPAPRHREEIRRVLELVQQGKLTPEDGERLISAMR